MKNLLIAFSLAIFSSGALSDTTVLVLNGDQARSVFRKFKAELQKQDDQSQAKKAYGLLKCAEIIVPAISYRCTFSKNILELEGADAREVYRSLNIGIIKRSDANWKGSFGTLSCLVDDNASYQCYFDSIL